jgi:hypothetical protein
MRRCPIWSGASNESLTSVRTEGVILVERDADGEVTVTRAGDHRGRKGADWGGGVGLVVWFGGAAAAGVHRGRRRGGRSIGRVERHPG